MLLKRKGVVHAYQSSFIKLCRLRKKKERREVHFANLNMQRTVHVQVHVIVKKKYKKLQYQHNKEYENLRCFFY